MDPLLNPYTPNAGATPAAIVGRDDQLATFDLLLARLKRGRPEQSMIISGLRGVGKTVLLNSFRKKALAVGWVTVDLEASKHNEEGFREQLFHKLRSALFELAPRDCWGQRLRKAAQILSSFALTFDSSGNLSVGLDIEPLEGHGDSRLLSLDLSELFVALGEAAQEADRGIVLLLDEIQFLSQPQLEAVVEAIHKTVQRSLPITLVGAGLPQIAELTGDAKSYAERLFKFVHVGSLSEADSAKALAAPAAVEGATFTKDALARAFEKTEGYPYFIQELGSSIWTTAEDSPFTAEDVEHSLGQYESKLDGSFYRVRFDRTTRRQATYLRAMAGLGPEPQKADAVAEAMGLKTQQVGTIRKELIDMGLLFQPSWGYAQFTVPHFDKFMLRVMPTLEVEEPRSQRDG